MEIVPGLLAGKVLVMMKSAMNENKHIVAIETSGRIGGVALARGSQLLCEKQFTGDQQHTSQLFPLLDELCRQQNWRPDQIDELYVSVGPGSFTGLRVGITAVKTLAYAREIKVIAVPSTDVLAMNFNADLTETVRDIQNVAVVMDAKRQQVYAAVYSRLDLNNGNSSSVDAATGAFIPGFKEIVPPTVIKPDELLAQTLRPLAILGEGLRWHREQLTDQDVYALDESYWQPLARNVHRCGLLRAEAGLYAQADQLTPLYLRRPEAVEKWEQLHGTNV